MTHDPVTVALVEAREVDFEVWCNLAEARRIYARIGVDPLWRQHRADAEAETGRNLGRPKETSLSRADIAEEAVFFASLGMPAADVVERLKQRPGVIARALRHVGEGALADKFAAYAALDQRRTRGAA